MFPTPAHDGVRLFLPTFFFLAAFAGWGTIWLADALARALRLPGAFAGCAWPWPALVLGPSAVALVRIHPYELSYYNELVGGPRGAWEQGFELTYWYDAFNGRVLDDLNRRAPAGCRRSTSSTTRPDLGHGFQELQTLGILRGDIVLAGARTRTSSPTSGS